MWGEFQCLNEAQICGPIPLIQLSVRQELRTPEITGFPSEIIGVVIALVRGKNSPPTNLTSNPSFLNGTLFSFARRPPSV